ncbi:MAG: cephalosporin hydroxylase family protein [Desulfobacca sp.]|nr:cephalosporin hydroxylase family protein [Desulfobacca sp.]
MKALFEAEKRKNISELRDNQELKSFSKQWIADVSRYKYSYNFSWLGRPIIQFPQDIIAMQELIWQIKPELIIETGVAHGGSLVFYASMLELLGENGRVVGIDIDIREHNRREIEAHPLYRRIHLVQGDSTTPAIVDEVYGLAAGKAPTLVALDSNHTHEHVLKELTLYSPLVTRGSYLVVFDTIIEDFPAGYFHNRPWDKGNNPKTAVTEFLAANDRFILDRDMESKLLITVAPGGYLKCIAD